MWYEIAIMALIFAVGNILFGHFEERTPKWRKLLKLVALTSIAALISYYGGRIAFHIFLGVGSLFVLVVHGWLLPKKGINGWTGEPKDKYYEFRGWEKKA